MPVYPQQLRSVDPWAEGRFSDNYNLRSRVLTRGIDSIVYLDSFAMAETGTTSFSIGPGIAIKDDVMIHIQEATTINLAAESGYVFGSEGEPPLSDTLGEMDIHVCLSYKYNRSIPAPAARYTLIKFPELHFDPEVHMWLGMIHTIAGVISEVRTEAIRIPDNVGGVIYRRHYIDPLSGYTTVNGGVIRPEIPGGTPDGWYEEWQYI